MCADSAVAVEDFAESVHTEVRLRIDGYTQFVRLLSFSLRTCARRWRGRTWSCTACGRRWRRGSGRAPTTSSTSTCCANRSTPRSSRRRCYRATYVTRQPRSGVVSEVCSHKKRTANVHRTGGWRSSRHLVLQRNIFVYMFFLIRPALNTRHVYVYTFTKSIKQLYKIHTGLKKCIDNDQMFSCHTSCFHGVGGG